MHPIITIFCAFTRRWSVDRWLENLAGVEHDPSLTNLCFIIDTDEPYIRNMLQKFAEQRGYRSCHIEMNSEHHPNEVRLVIRRTRIAQVKNQSKDLVARTDGKYIISFEDDTVFDRLKNFNRLLNPLAINPKVGFVEGVQMGRWGVNMIGAWLADNDLDPTTIKTLLPKSRSALDDAEWYENITGGGWYGYATRRDLYLNCDYYWATSQPWGADVNYGFWLKQRGYKVLIDWQTVFGHDDRGRVGYPDEEPFKHKLAQVIYTKNVVNGKWDREDHEQGRYL